MLDQILIARLEKVRADYDKLSEILDDVRYEWSKDILAYHELRDKLEAVKNLKREGLNNWNEKGDYYWLKISEILEAEG